MTSPNNNAIWQVLDDEKSAFRRSLKVVVVDEAHCMLACGAPTKNGKPPFRKKYANIGGLRAILPASVPFLAMSATLPQRSLRYIHNSLGLSKNTVLIKLRLDRPNIFLCAILIHGILDDHADFNMLVPEINEHSETTIIPGDIPKTMVFVDNVSAVMRIVHQLRWLLPARLQDADVVRPYHGEASASGNAKTQQLFREGNMRLLVCISDAGMGVDVNNVERVAQWRFPLLATFDDLWQRFGQCTRDPKLSGLAMLFYEPSKIVDWGVGDGHVLEGFRTFNKASGTDTQAFCDDLYTGEKPDVMNEAQRKVRKQDHSLLWWVSSRGCRRRTTS